MIDSEAWDGVFLAHRSQLIEYAAPILGSREAAEDIVQDAFIRFMPAKTRIVSPEQTLSYLYRIVRNLAFDVIKRRKIEKREAEGNPPFWIVSRIEQTPEQTVLLCDQIKTVNRILGALPVEARIAVEMSRFGGFTLEEIAAHLDISVATAHRHIRSAMVLIAAQLDHPRH